MAVTLDRRIDPVTGDFVDAARGAFATCDVLENKIALSLLLPLGSWEGDPELGHRFKEVERAKDLPATRERIGDLVREALAWLVASGELAQLDVKVESFAPGKVVFQADCYPPGKPVIPVGPYYVAVAI